MVQSEIATMMVLWLSLMMGGAVALLTRWMEREGERVVVREEQAGDDRIHSGSGQRAWLGLPLMRRCSLTTGGGSFDWT